MNNFKQEQKGLSYQTYSFINIKLDKMRSQKRNQAKSTNSSFKTLATENIYEQTKPNIKLIMNDYKALQLDEKLNEMGKVSKYSVYGADFANWGGLE